MAGTHFALLSSFGIAVSGLRNRDQGKRRGKSNGHQGDEFFMELQLSGVIKLGEKEGCGSTTNLDSIA